MVDRDLDLGLELERRKGGKGGKGGGGGGGGGEEEGPSIQLTTHHRATNNTLYDSKSDSRDELLSLTIQVELFRLEWGWGWSPP